MDWIGFTSVYYLYCSVKLSRKVCCGLKIPIWFGRELLNNLCDCIVLLLVRNMKIRAREIHM